MLSETWFSLKLIWLCRNLLAIIVLNTYFAFKKQGRRTSKLTVNGEWSLWTQWHLERWMFRNTSNRCLIVPLADWQCQAGNRLPCPGILVDSAVFLAVTGWDLFVAHERPNGSWRVATADHALKFQFFSCWGNDLWTFITNASHSDGVRALCKKERNSYEMNI